LGISGCVAGFCGRVGAALGLRVDVRGVTALPLGAVTPGAVAWLDGVAVDVGGGACGSTTGGSGALGGVTATGTLGSVAIVRAGAGGAG
jgi:hypothetical protein